MHSDLNIKNGEKSRSSCQIAFPLFRHVIFFPPVISTEASVLHLKLYWHLIYFMYQVQYTSQETFENKISKHSV